MEDKLEYFDLHFDLHWKTTLIKKEDTASSQSLLEQVKLEYEVVKQKLEKVMAEKEYSPPKTTSQVKEEF